MNIKGMKETFISCIINKWRYRFVGIFACLFFIVTQAHALPDTQQGLSIGGVIVDSTGAPAYNINEILNPDFYGQILPGEFTVCTTQFVLFTEATTNSFFNNVDFSGCPDMIGNGAIYYLFGGLSTTLDDSLGTDILEIIRFSRSAPNAPISIRFEPYGIAHDNIINITPSIVDQNANVLFTGQTVSATEDGIGPLGSTAYTAILDGVPDDIVAANVTRILQLSVSSVNLVTNVYFQLTFETSAGGNCTELLHIGPAEQSPTPINASFGCASQLPPGNCLDKSNAALKASRDYQKATREVLNRCGRKDSTDCATVLQQQIDSYTSLQTAQDEVQIYCSK